MATNVAAMQISLFGDETHITNQFPEVREKVRRALQPDQTIQSLELTLDHLPGKISLSRVEWNGKPAWLVCYLDSQAESNKPLDWIIESSNYDVRFPFRSSNSKFRSLFYHHPEVALYLNRYGRIVDINRQGLDTLGYTKAHLLGKHYQNYLNRKDRAAACKHFDYTMTTGACTSYEAKVLYQNGIKRMHKVLLIPAYEDHVITGVFAISRDISHQINTHNTELDRSMFEKAARVAGDIIWDYDLKTQEIWWSSGLEQHFGYKLYQPVTPVTFWFGKIHPDDFHRVLTSYKNFRHSGDEFWEIRYRFLRADHTYAYVSDRALLIKDEHDCPARLVGAIVDETELHQKQRELKNSLREKEHLIAEVHHRVKNNMALITSILELQTDFVDDDKLVKIIENSQSRIKSIAMVHEELYRSESFSRIAVGEHIKQIALMHQQSYEYKGKQFELDMDIDDLHLNINQAIPLSLLVGELISNAMAHAYPDKNEGSIFIAVKEQERQLHIIIQDEGIGMEENPLGAETLGMGYTLISTLLMQLEADYEIDSQNGLRFYFHFPVEDQLKGSGSSMMLEN